MPHHDQLPSDGSGRSEGQLCEPRDDMAAIAPHWDPRLRNQTSAELIRRPVSHARGGTLLYLRAESTELVLSCAGIVLVLACALFDAPHWLGRAFVALGWA